MAVDVEKFWRDGFLLFPRLFDPEEVLEWRDAAISRGKTLADLLSDDVLREVVIDERIISIAREILGGDLVYFGDSTAALGYNGWGFHKDNSDRLDRHAPDWQVERYPLIRFGIYPQSHDPEPGGLELRRASHRVADYTTGEYVAPKIRPGDLLVWNFRTTHSAGVRRLKILGTRLPHNKIIGRINTRIDIDWLMQKPSAQRVGIFLTLAKQHPLLDRHIEYLKQRDYPWDMWRSSKWTPDTRQLVEAAGLSLIDLTKSEYDGRELHEHYNPLPY